MGIRAGEDLPAQLSGIRDRVEEYNRDLKNLTGIQEELRRFDEEFPGEKRTAFEGVDLPPDGELAEKQSQLTNRLETIQKSMHDAQIRLSTLREQYDDWCESKRKLEEKRARREKETREYHNLMSARDLLRKAKESMTAQYSSRIYTSFSDYFSLLTNEESGDFRMDANAGVTYFQYGKQRDKETFSTGYRDLIGFCQRIALVDAMYNEERPCLILDDPFANMDDEKIEAAKRLLDRLKEQYQIIYLTCSSAR